MESHSNEQNVDEAARQKQMEESLKKLKESYLKQHFDKELRAFVKQAKECTKTRYQYDIKLGDTITELTCCDRYMKLYYQMEPEEHYQYFETLYNRNRAEFLNCIDDDEFLSNGNLVIQFGEGIKDIVEKCKNVKIMISKFYQSASHLQSKCDNPDDIDSIRPKILMLHLFRIFYHLNEGTDKLRLGEIVTSLEKDLRTKTLTVGSEPWARVNSGEPSSLSGLFNIAKGMMSKFGINLPDNFQPPSDNEVSDLMNNIFENADAQRTLQTVVTSLKDCDNLNDAIKTVVQNVTDEKTMSTIQESLKNVPMSSQQSPQQSPQQ